MDLTDMVQPGMTYSRILAISAGALLVSAACSSSDAPNVVTGSLSPIHAEPDTENGGRFVDAEGREVMFSGINVNSYGEYWQWDPEIAPTFPFGEEDVDRFESIGWNAVRLLLTWSRVEPTPGEYDEAYLDEIEDAVRLIESRGLYTIIDFHQDAWGPSLSAREDENCPEGYYEAVGWDGAPEWATQDNDASRCIEDHPVWGEREFSPAVIQAFLSFWEDREGPGGVGIQTRFHTMLRHVARRFSKFDCVLGYDPMNEPNALSETVATGVAPEIGEQSAELEAFYERALEAIREGERLANSPNRLMLFEPSFEWVQLGPNSVIPVFEHDGQTVYSPHIYQEGIDPGTLDDAVFERVHEEAAMNGGVPVLTGEWGTQPQRATDPEDDYFERHQGLQDRYRVSATQWLWRAACGDPHYARDPYEGVDPTFWGYYDIDCPSNETIGFREDYAAVVRRPLMRAAPGRIASILWDYENDRYTASGTMATPGQKLLLFLHEEIDASQLTLTGLETPELEKAIGPGEIWSAITTAEDWTIEVTF